MVDHLGIPMNMPVAKGWPCGAAMSCAKGELWKGDVGDYERKPTDLYSPSDRGTGERWRHGQQVDACNHPQCVEDRRELAAARVTLAEKRLELARLRTALRAAMVSGVGPVVLGAAITLLVGSGLVHVLVFVPKKRKKEAEEEEQKPRRNSGSCVVA